MVAVQVHHRFLALTEQCKLGSEVVFPVRMLYRGDVVIVYVEKCPDREADSQDPVVFQRLRRHLHSHEGQPLFESVAEVPLEIYGFRGGQVRLESFSAVVRVDG